MGVSIAAKVSGELVSTYLPFRHATGGNLDKSLINKLEQLLSSGKILIFHNAKFDLVSLATLGVNLPANLMFYDTMLICHLINENRPMSKSLDSCADHYLEHGIKRQHRETELDIKRAKRNGYLNEIPMLEARLGLIESQIGTFKKSVSEELKKWIDSFGWANIPVKLMTPYARQDAVLTYQLMLQIYPLFKDEGVDEHWNHKVRFTKVLAAIEATGVRINTELCIAESIKGTERMAAIIKELNGFNPASPLDLKILLIDMLELPIFKVTPGGKPSFDKFAMELYDFELEFNDSPIAKLVLEYRGWQKTVSSNYSSYLTLLSPDGRLRPNFKMHGTRTGRLSCEKPNLQQIPKVSDKVWNGHLKEAFIPDDGYRLFEADYAQLELRLTAAYADEKSLLQVFEEGRDIFDEMSQRLGMVRQDCKTFVYSTQYGAGIRRIKTALKLTEMRAQEVRQNYRETYPNIKLLSDRTQATAKAHGRIKLWTGRWRHFLNAEEESHKAMNSLMQGGGADIVERQMVRLYNDVVMPSSDECRMLLQIHDSVVFEVKIGTEDKYLPMIKEIMEDVDSLLDGGFGVKFAIDIHEWGAK